MGSIAGNGSILPLSTLILAVIICLFLMRKYWKKRKGNDNVRMCPNCRQPVENDSAYCENCGAKIPAATEAAGNRTGIGKIFKKKLTIIISAACLVFIPFALFIITHLWRWEYGIGNSENIYGIGAYGSGRRGEDRYGLYRRHWYGYEDLTNGYTLDTVQVSNHYIATKHSGSWRICTPNDYKYGDLGIFSDIMPPISNGNGNTYQGQLAKETGMVWVKSIDISKWGTINVVGQNYSVDFLYDDVFPEYEFDNDGANIICKRDNLWGTLHIPYATGSKITESVPFIFSNPEHIKNYVEIVNDYYVVAAEYARIQFANMVYSNGRIDNCDSGYIWSKGDKLLIKCIYSGYAFLMYHERWHCIPESELERL